MNQRSLGLENIERELLWHFTRGTDGRLYFAGEHGMVVTELKENGNLFSKPFLISEVNRVNQFPKQVGKNYHRTINAFKAGDEVYYSVYRDGIYKLERNSAKKIFPTPSGDFNDPRITAYEIVDDSTIIWGAYNTLVKHSTKTDTFEAIPLTTNTSKAGYPVLSLQVKEVKANSWKAWVGVRDGVMELSYPDGNSWFFDHDSTGNFPLKGTDIMAIEETADSILWVGTFNAGVAQKNLKTGGISYFNESNGLANDQVYGLLIDHKGRVWVSHNQGISCIFPDENEIQNFSLQEGTRMTEFNQNGFSKVAEQLFFSGVNGGIVFHPDSVLQTFKDNSKLNFTRLKFNRISPEKTENVFFIDKKEISIPYEDRTFELGFSDLSFTGDNRSYSYRIKSQSKDWQELSSDLKTIFVNNLGIGRHKIEIRQKSTSGIWKEPELALAVNIIPPFWLTKWFVGLMILIGIFGLTFASHKISGFYYSNRIKKLESEKKVQTERERLSRDLHDSLGSQLSIIMRHLEHVEPAKTGDSKTRLTAAKKAAHFTIRQMRESLWALKKEKIQLSVFSERIKELAKRSLEGTGITFVEDFKIRRDIQVQPIEMLHLLRIVHEAVGNAIKYSEAETVILNVESDLRSRWKICVIDDGVGFNVNQVYKNESYGLTHIYKRAEEIGASVSIKSTLNNGTEICINIGEM